MEVRRKSKLRVFGDQVYTPLSPEHTRKGVPSVAGAGLDKRTKRSNTALTMILVQEAGSFKEGQYM